MKIWSGAKRKFAMTDIVVADTKFPQYQNLVFAAQDKNWIKKASDLVKKEASSSSLPRSFLSQNKDHFYTKKDRPHNLSSSFPLSFQNPWKKDNSAVFLFFFRREKGGRGGERGRGKQIKISSEISSCLTLILGKGEGREGEKVRAKMSFAMTGYILADHIFAPCRL